MRGCCILAAVPRLNPSLCATSEWPVEWSAQEKCKFAPTVGTGPTFDKPMILSKICGVRFMTEPYAARQILAGNRHLVPRQPPETGHPPSQESCQIARIVMFSHL